MIINQEIVTELSKSSGSSETYVIPTDELFQFNRLSSINVRNANLKINTSKPIGHDQISPKFLKDSADSIADLLSVIFSKSIETGIFSDNIKVARISPMYKGGGKTKCSKYRSISIISVVAKVFE